MEIREIKERYQYLSLLLLADEQLSMVEKYIDKGKMYGLYAPDLKGVCIIIKRNNQDYEIKNLAIDECYQGKGYGKLFIKMLIKKYKGNGWLYVGTGESPKTLPFYQKCGFSFDYRIKDFFTLNYDHPIIEDRVVLKDMIYLKQKL